MSYRKISESALRTILTGFYEYIALRDYGGIDPKLQKEANAKFVSDCIVIDEQHYDSLEDVVEEDITFYKII